MSSDGIVLSSAKENVGKKQLAWQYAELCLQKGLYPGGVFWIQGQKKDISEQIIGFAEDEFDLSVSEIPDIEGKLNYCWSNWRKGEALIIISDAGDYEWWKDFLPPIGRHFKVIITTKESCRKSWPEESFTPLKLNTLSQGDSNRNRKLSSSKDVSLLFGVWVAFQISLTLSLLASYHWVESAAWQDRFQRDGWLIEFFRSFLLYGLFSAVYCYFKREAIELYKPSEGFRAPILSLRTWILVAATGCLGLLFKYHIDDGPRALAEYWSNTPSLASEEGFQMYQLPYLYYFPYSVLNFIFVGITTLSIGVYAVIKDMGKLSHIQEQLRQDLETVGEFVHSEVRQVFFKEIICQKIEKDFENYCQRLTETIGRYTFLFLVFSIGVAFEVLVGRTTLANTALTWIFVAYVFLALMIGGMLLCYAQYDVGLKESARLLSNLSYEGLNFFEERHSTIRFFQRLFRDSIYVYISVFALVVSLTVYLFFEVFLANG